MSAMGALLVLALLVIGGFAAETNAFRGEFNSITIGAAHLLLLLF